MSVYFSDANEDEVFGASNRGWGDVCRFVKTTGTKFPFLVHLTDEGWVSPPKGLETELKKVIGSHSAAPDVRGVLQTLLEFSSTAEEIVLVGDGMGAAGAADTKDAPDPIE